jgi:triosephosphate isomerase
LVDIFGRDVGADVPILYGSVNPDNCASIFSIDTVSGVLVGRSGLDANEFFALVATAESRQQRIEEDFGTDIRRLVAIT